MPRKPKCKYCKKELENPFTVIVNDKKENYCSEEEYKFIIREKNCYKKILELCKNILGYKTFNTIVGKEIKELHNEYSYEIIYICIQKYKQDIEIYIDLNDINKEYNKIKYMFAIIKNNIADISLEKKEIKDEKINIEEFDMFDYRYKPKKTDNFLDFLKEE